MMSAFDVSADVTPAKRRHGHQQESREPGSMAQPAQWIPDLAALIRG